MCTYSAGCLVISPSSGHGGAAANNIPYGIALLDVQRRRVPALSPEKQPPQIRHLAADNRKQFRVRAQGPGKEFRAWRGSGNEQRCSRGDFRWLRAQRVRCLCDEKQLHNGLRMEAYNLIVHSDIQFLMNLHQ